MTLFQALAGSVTFILLLLVLLTVIIALATSMLTRNIAGAINKIDLDQADNVFNELDEFFQKAMSRDRKVESQISELRAYSKTQNALIENMQDGFVMVDPSGKVVTANPKAIALFGARQEPVGKNIINLLADTVFLEKVDAALRGTGSQMTLQKAERVVQLSFVPSANRGAIVLTSDITEKEQAEKMRREFSANVSHELKTPLTTISGFAELMVAGMVNPVDMAHFAGKIDTEAKRMIQLIENILFLSNLDEQDAHKAFAMEDIAEIAADAVDGLTHLSEKHQVKVNLTATSIKINCNKLLVYEMLMNLIGNAIRYNILDGSVDIAIKAKHSSENVPADGNSFCHIIISDTGIGIPKAEQPHVFERFYRVEQSRGRKTGGAGLGLSIVKHIVRYHNGSIVLSSEPGKGTQVEVLIPIKGAA